ncbi:hypothetical protein QYF36_001700 [Acer negundo]|nr:hypothetical protein QYF36_001700 [Acer negundo]
MTCIQATSLCANLPTRPLSKLQPSPPFQTFFRPTKTHNQKLCTSLKRLPLCLIGGKDRAEDERATWKSFGKAMEKFSKGQSIEDVLRQQMENKDYHVGGNGSKNPPCGGGGGGGGGGGRDSFEGSSEDEGVMNETMQVILATIGFIFLYIYIIRGEELTRLGKDYIRGLISIATMLIRNIIHQPRALPSTVVRLVFGMHWQTIVTTILASSYSSITKNFRQVFLQCGAKDMVEIFNIHNSLEIWLNQLLDYNSDMNI